MQVKKILSWLLLAIMLLGIACPGLAAETKSRNPLLDPYTLQYATTADDFLNILLLGLDVSTSSFGTSGNKRNLMDAHTDVVMLVSINLTKGRIDLVSVPRDTMVYVPGVRGVYKLNAAFNTGTTVLEGLSHTRDTVSWFMGGLRINAYCALDLEAMAVLGDVMGGIDYDLEMSYSGGNGRKYEEGFQHLDGMGIADYVRARRNARGAAKDRTDLGRTDRGRRMMIAIFDKIKSDYNMLNELWAATQRSDVNFYTDLNGVDTLLNLWDFFQEIDGTEIGSYVFDGSYEDYVLGYWSMHIIDQDARIKLLKEVYGINAKPISYVSKDYAHWLLGNGSTTGGFQAVQKIRQAKQILDYAYMRSKPSKDLQKAIKTLASNYNASVEAFDNSADRRAGADAKLQTALNKLVKSAENTAKLCSYPNEVRWEKAKLWYEDPLINEYYEINWR